MKPDTEQLPVKGEIVIRITTVKSDPEPEEFRFPAGYLPEYIHELAQVRERKYRHTHLKTAVEIIGLEGSESPVKLFLVKGKFDEKERELLNG